MAVQKIKVDIIIANCSIYFEIEFESKCITWMFYINNTCISFVRTFSVLNPALDLVPTTLLVSWQMMNLSCEC